MADIKLFNINGKVRELQSGTVTLEKELQNIIEKNMKSFFGVSFLKSEFSTTDGGRMDSIGIDENNCPVIFEYKRSLNENVINQGLFYLNWLLDHKESFTLLVIDVLGLERSKSIDWTRPRVVCIANDFTKYDISAINQMTRNISLIRYKKFENDLLMFEHINDKVVDQIEDVSTSEKMSKNYQKRLNKKYRLTRQSRLHIKLRLSFNLFLADINNRYNTQNTYDKKRARIIKKHLPKNTMKLQKR